MKKSEMVLIAFMACGVWVLRAVCVPIQWFADLCFELAVEMQNDR